MPGKHTNLSQIKRILALREVGATRATIAAEVGLSISTVGRICKRFSSRKGRASSRLVKQAQEELYNRLSNDQVLMQEAMKHLADDLAAGQLIREKIAEAVLKLHLSDPDQVANALRALNSASSALATVQKVGRIATGADKLVNHETELPVLQIYEMTPDDIAEIRAQQLRDQEEIEGGGETDDTEVIH